MHWKIEDLIDYPLISEVAPSPDGRLVAFVAREALMTEERSEFLTHLFLADAAGEAPVQLTFGQHSDHSPRWSPDGQFLAFISTRGGHAELRAMRASGGESWLLATLKGSEIASPAWSRDGARLAFLAPAAQPEERERASRARDDAFRWGDQHRPSQIWSVPFSVGPRTPAAPAQVTRGPFHVLACTWLADGAGLAFTAMPSTVAEDWPKTWLGTIPAAGGEPQRLGEAASWNAAPHVSPDGHWIACPASDGPPRWALAARVTLFPAAGGEPRVLAATPDAQPNLLGWAPDGAAVYVHEAEGVTQRLLALPVDGGPPQPLDGPPMFEVAGLGLGGQIAVAGQDFHSPNAIFLAERPGAEPRRLGGAPMPAGWPDAALPRAEVLRWEAPDGQAVEGILTHPLTDTAGPAPLVVIIHGGPTGVYQRSYLGSPAGYGPIGALAERGYATLRCNPRGSSGYGRAFRFANYGDWGGGDFQDIMAGVDTLVARGLADPERLAVMGWSYGGYLSSWAITQTDRFKAACIGAPVTDPVSFNGTADIPGFIPDYFGAEHWDDLDTYRRQSPIHNIGRARTPALIQHGDADIRVPLGQGRQLYEALRRRGIPSELVVYPRQGHLFSEPRMIIDCRNRVLEWLARYLG
jgi:dipeptidyl aminopeptidase/acylaminoacyl peptidase